MSASKECSQERGIIPGDRIQLGDGRCVTVLATVDFGLSRAAPRAYYVRSDDYRRRWVTPAGIPVVRVAREPLRLVETMP